MQGALVYPYVDRYTDHRSPKDRYMHRYMHARYDPRTHEKPTRSISPPISPHFAFPTLFLTPARTSGSPAKWTCPIWVFCFLPGSFLFSSSSPLPLLPFVIILFAGVSDAARGACRRNPCVSLCPRACLSRRCRSSVKALSRLD